MDATETLPTDECDIFTAQLGGAAGRVSSDAMAYPHRSTRFTMNIHGRWRRSGDDERVIAWVRKLYERSSPFSTGSVYINFVPEAREVRRVGTFGMNEARLRQIKTKLDPLNISAQTFRSSRCAPVSAFQSHDGGDSRFWPFSAGSDR